MLNTTTNNPFMNSASTRPPMSPSTNPFYSSRQPQHSTPHLSVQQPGPTNPSFSIANSNANRDRMGITSQVGASVGQGSVGGGYGGYGGQTRGNAVGYAGVGGSVGGSGVSNVGSNLRSPISGLHSTNTASTNITSYAAFRSTNFTNSQQPQPQPRTTPAPNPLPGNAPQHPMPMSTSTPMSMPTSTTTPTPSLHQNSIARFMASFVAGLQSRAYGQNDEEKETASKVVVQEETKNGGNQQPGWVDEMREPRYRQWLRDPFQQHKHSSNPRQQPPLTSNSQWHFLNPKITTPLLPPLPSIPKINPPLQSPPLSPVSKYFTVTQKSQSHSLPSIAEFDDNVVSQFCHSVVQGGRAYVVDIVWEEETCIGNSAREMHEGVVWVNHNPSLAQLKDLIMQDLRSRLPRLPPTSALYLQSGPTLHCTLTTPKLTLPAGHTAQYTSFRSCLITGLIIRSQYGIVQWIDQVDASGVDFLTDVCIGEGEVELRGQLDRGPVLITIYRVGRVEVGALARRVERGVEVVAVDAEGAWVQYRVDAEGARVHQRSEGSQDQS